MTREGGRVRVAHVIKGLGRGGAEGLLPQTIAASSPDFQYRVAYFLPHKNALVADVEAAGAPATCLGGSSSVGVLLRWPRLAAYLRRTGVDLVHAHLPVSGVAARLAARRAGLPVVYTEHNVQERYRPATRWLNRRTWGLQQEAIAVSSQVAASIAKSFGSTVPVRVIQNGIRIDDPPSPAARDEVRSALGFAPGDVVVGTVAVLRRQKRLDLWLQAARSIAAAAPAARFLIVGDGPLADDVRRAAAPLGDRVVLTGLRSDVPELLAAMDVFVSSSQFEGLPLALLEAMAAGLPVVATAVGGVPEVVTEACGRLVAFGAVEPLAVAVTELIAEPAARRALGAAGRRRVEERFSVGRMAAELEACYRHWLCGARRDGEARVG